MILANLSGGIDSVYGVYLLLKQGEEVLIHHCNLAGNKRVQWETKATIGALEWYMDQGLDNFKYVQSDAVIPYGFDNDGWKRRLRMIRDAELVMVMAGSILRAEKSIKTLAYFNNKEDSTTKYPNSRETKARIAALNRTARRKIQIIRPICHLTKADIIERMPEELFELSSWCRFPDSEGEPCHKCHTCRKVDAVME